MGLFDKKTPEELEAAEFDRLSKEDLENRSDQADQQVIEDSRRQAQDLVGFNTVLIRPTQISIETRGKLGKKLKSQFHTMVTQDFKISNIERADVNLATAYQSIWDQFLDMGLLEIALVLHAEFEGRWAAYGSVGGFERKMLVTSQAIITKNQGQQQKQGGILR